MYVTGPKYKNKVIVCYDIFGDNNSTRIRLLCDSLAENGYTAILPDFFHGKPFGTDIKDFKNLRTDFIP